MNLRDLRYLVTVAETRHFGKAAQQCFVSQPTLSGQIKKLELDLGVVIFERTRRSVDITPAGEGILVHARQILEQADAIQQLARSFQNLFVVHDWENYGHYYSDTLAAWQANFEHNWDRIAAIETDKPFDERFRRMWNYYLMASKAGFDVENLLLWQIVMSKAGKRDRVYDRVNLGR